MAASAALSGKAGRDAPKRLSMIERRDDTALISMPEVNARKFYTPVCSFDVIAREDLVARCLSDPLTRIIVLQAPAGHGKTTALLQLKEQSERSGAKTAWLTFDSADNDTRRFSVHIQAAVEQLAPAGAPEIDEPADTGGVRRRRSDWLVNRLGHADRDIVLFFDEFQSLTSTDLLLLFQELFERLPENVRVCVGSRTEPAISLSRMVVSGRALILRTEDLRFSRNEVSRYFDGMLGIDVSHQEIESIYRQTEGWPVAIQLYGLGLASADVRRSLSLPAQQAQELDCYLSTRVLALQSPEVREFLLKSSVLRKLCAPLCEAVTGRANCSQLLDDLERSGLFLRRLGSDGIWFKYHGLFSGFLSEELQRLAPEEARAAHRKAALWNLKSGYHEDAVHHLVECGDFGECAEILAAWGKDLVASGSLVTLEFWAQQIPFNEVAKRRDLAIAVAYALVFLRRPNRLIPLLESFSGVDSVAIENTTSPAIVLSMFAVASDDTAKAFDLIDRVPIESLSPNGFSAFELGAASNLQAYRALTLGRFADIEHHIVMARHCNEVGKAAFSHGYTVGVAGVSALIQGQLSEALRLCRRGLTTHYAELGQSFSLAALASCYVWALYEAGDYDAALGLFLQHQAIIAESALPDFFAVAYLSAVRAYSITHERASAATLLEEAAEVCRRSRWPRLSALFDWERVRSALAREATDEAMGIASSIELNVLPDGWIPFSEEMESQSLGQLRLLVHNGCVDNAKRLLEAEKNRFPNRVLRSRKLQLLDVVLHERVGDRRGAQRLLQRILRAAEIDGYVSLFAEEGTCIARLLQDMYGSWLPHNHRSSEMPIDLDFVTAVLKSCHVGVSSTREEVGTRLSEPLSERELDVLALLGSGVRNKGIAKSLFVSENTVKFHLKNIFVKLGANSRSEAITTARRLGLID